MLEKLHDHIVEELSVNTKTDIIFIITAIFLNFLALAINSAMAFSPEYFFIFIFWMKLFLSFFLLVVFCLMSSRRLPCIIRRLS